MRRWRSLALGVGLVLLAACSGPAPSRPAAVPVHAETRDGRFVLMFDLPKDTYGAGEPIEGVASLALDGGAAVPFGASGGGPFVFGFTELDGPRRMGGSSSADCRAGLLLPGQPITSGITKSVAYVETDPLAPFYKAFQEDPVVRLPPGDWKIDVYASFVEHRDCSGDDHTMTAPVTVHISP